MKITLRPYNHDKSRWHVDIRLMNPCNSEQEIRKRKVAPAGLSKAQARAWAEHQVPKILREVLGSDGVSEKAKVSKDRKETTTTLRLVPNPSGAEITLEEFYRERFDLEYVSLQKPATQVSYESVFRNHIGPHLGELPLAAIDEDQLSKFRAKLRRSLAVSTANLVLAKVAKILRFAKRVRAIAAVPEVEMLPSPRSRPKKVLSDEEIEALLAAARSISQTSELVCLLTLDAGLRSSELCALEWGDVDLKAGTITVQHNTYRGKKQTPKGTIGKVAMTSALREALARHRKREPIGPLVLYHQSVRWGDEWRPHTLHSIRHTLTKAQRKAGIRETGPHLLRHTALTRLANLGASPYTIQAVARHSQLVTTQRYLHQQKGGLAREAAELLDRAAAGKTLAKTSKVREKQS